MEVRPTSQIVSLNLPREDTTVDAVAQMPDEVPRTAWQDNARAIGIVLVVFGHAERGLRGAGILKGLTWQSVDFGLYTFHMPLFMFLAGLNVLSSLEKPGFIRKKTRSLLLPYLIWSVIQILVMFVLGRYTNNHINLHRLTTIGWEPISPFWFLYILYSYMLIVSVIRPTRWLFLIAAITLLLSPYMRWDILSQFTYFFAYFIVGCLVGSRNSRIPMSALLVGSVIFVSSLAIGFVYHLDYYSPLMLPASIAGITLVIGVAQQLPAIKAVLFIGKTSLVIYVMHILCTAGMRIALTIAGIHNGGVHIVLGVAAGVVLPLFIYAVLDRLRLARFVGLPPHVTWGQYQQQRPATGI